MSPTPVRKRKKQRGIASRTLPRRRIVEKVEDEDADDETPISDQSSKVLPEEINNNVTASSSRYSLRSSRYLNSTGKPFGSLGESISTPMVKTPGGRISLQTPYRTPKIRSAISDYTQRKKFSKEWKDDINGLLNKTWKVCHLSTMTSFQYKKTNLRKIYESTLRIRILEAYPAFKLTVNLRTSSCLRQDKDAVDAVIFTVTSFVPGEISEDDREVIIYVAWLFRTTEVQSLSLPGAEWFPLMLYSGSEVIHRVVITWLQASFGCYVTPRGFPTHALLWIAGIWSRDECSVKGHELSSAPEVMFQYHAYPPLPKVRFDPPNDKCHVSFTLKCFASDIRNIWRRIEPEKGEILEESERLSFHEAMNDFVTLVTNIPSSLLHLYNLRTPCISIARDGRVKLLCVKKFTSLLAHLLEIFLDAGHTNILKNIRNDEDLH